MVSFSNLDLSEIQIPFANLTNGVFHNTNFQNSNLENVNFQHANISNSNFSCAKLNNCKFRDYFDFQLHEEEAKRA